MIVPGTFSRLAIVCAVTGTGPQSWKGEMMSYGSGTETRYGSGGTPQASAIEAVSPPELEKKYVVATLPSNRSTWCLSRRRRRSWRATPAEMPR